MSKEKEVVKAYKRKQIESAKPVELILLLYDGALDFLRRAQKVYQPGKPETIEPFHKNLLACQNIIIELTVALDMENGGDVAQKLFQLYDYMNYRLVDINVTKKIEGINEVIELLETLKEGWVKLSENQNEKDRETHDKAGTSDDKHQGTGLNLQG